MNELAFVASRRSFTRLLGAGAALAAARPFLFAERAALAQAALAPTSEAPPLALVPSPAVVRLSSNENPYGPPPAAFTAMREAFAEANRYPDDAEERLVAALAALHGVAAEQVLLGCGSGQILHAAANAFTGPAAAVVTADPTFEALGRYSEKRGAKVTKVPLTADFRHDLTAMLALTAGAGLVYVCNPNNPTASLTPIGELRAFLDRLPLATTALVDEAYHHYADGTSLYESVIPLVATHPNLVVARTFSKIYGMAGLRCGYAVGHAERIAALRDQRPWDSVNVLALVAAKAALGERDHVARSRRLNGEVRTWTTQALGEAGHAVIPSAANFFMADLGRDVGPVIAALRGQGVEVGRRFGALPNHLRVTVGTEAEMNTFVAAFRRVVS